MTRKSEPTHISEILPAVMKKIHRRKERAERRAKHRATREHLPSQSRSN